MKKLIIIICLIWIGFPGIAQQRPRFNPDTIITITLDPVPINSKRISNETFIDLILRDTSFYQAFHNMKRFSFTAENSIYTYDKKDKVEGKIYRRINHEGPSKMQILAKRDSGKVYKKNGKYDLYTVQMFDYIFMNAYSSGFAPPPPSVGKKTGSDQSYKDKLKTLIFSPGHAIKGLPFIGNKTTLFTANMRQYYDYSFASGTYLDSIPVYRFKVTQKKNLSNWTKDGIMIKELTTIFDKRNLQILGRNIDMKWDNLAFSFDVKMNIELGYFNKTLLPTKVSYQGNWDVPFHNEERASFLILQRGYKLGNR
jgi:hypothetical protein